MIIGLLVLLGFVGSADAQPATGRVVGALIDEYNGIPLPGVPVEVVDSSEIAYTDLDGRFALDLPPGPHLLIVGLPGYAERRVAITVAAGRDSVVDIGISPMRFTEEVTVTAQAVEADTSTAQAQLVERRRSPVITDNLGAQEMKANADSNAASAMQRVTGVSVVDDEHVFVRGLGERYSNTLLSGAPLPSVDPDRRVVPLDLFPAGLIDSVQIEKSYMADRPAEFAGGLVLIQPLKFARTRTADVSVSFGGNSQTTFERVLAQPGGGRDWTGFDDGTRALPGAIPARKVVQGGIYTPDVGVLRSDLERLGESFSNVWQPTTRTAPLDESFSVVFGDRWGRFGLMTSFSYAQDHQAKEEVQRFFRASESAGLSIFSDYNLDQTSTRSTVGFVGNAAYQLTNNHQLAFESFSTHNGLSETRTFAGFNSDIATNIANARLRWIEEGVTTTQARGDHLFGGASRMDWRISAARATRDEPDLRETLYELNASTGQFVLADESQSGLRMFNDLSDQTNAAAANVAFFFTGVSELPAQVKFGAAYDRRERDFSSRRFRFVPQQTRGVDLSRPAEELFAPVNIGSVFDLREETRATDAYGARHDLTAGYGMVDFPMSTTWRLLAGARVERFEQQVDTFDPFSISLEPTVIRATLDDVDVFPSLNIVNSLTSEMNLRIGISQTVNRPEFRELAPFEFTDVVGGRAIVGSPDLTRALIRSVDVRWEWFPAAEELFAASFFYKDFTDPIERIIEPTAQLRTSFTNAESARNVGLEIEARRRLTDHAFVAVNYTYVDSQVTLADAARQVQTSLSRPLAGQSANLLNALVELRGGGYSGRLLYNYFGNRISDVGSLGLPDIVEKGRHSLDAVVSKAFGGRASLKVALGNLLDADFEFTQADQVQRLYRLGRSFSVSFGYSFF